MKMIILQINSDYAIGSTGKITECLHEQYLMSGHNSYVCYGRNTRYKSERVIPCISNEHSKMCHLINLLNGRKYEGCYLSTQKLIAEIKRIKPDVVHLQCINGYFVNIPFLLSWLAENHYLTVLTIHAEFMYTGGCEHAYDCKEWLSGCKKCDLKRKLFGIPMPNKSGRVFAMQKMGFDEFLNEQLYIVSVSGWMESRAKTSPMLNRFKHSVIYNPINEDVFFRHDDLAVIKSDLTHEKKMLFFVTAEFDPENQRDNKGGRYIVQLARKLKANKIPVKIVVAANYGTFNNLPDNIIYIGKVNEQIEMSKYYSMADVTLLASQRESFGMTVIESLCCGTPVIGFKAGGPETITSSEYATFVEYGDLESYYEVVMKYVCNDTCLDEETRFKISLNARKVYARDVIAKDYITVYKEILH